jgi:D-ribose pyranose/furanose isomerase RbsD
VRTHVFTLAVWLQRERFEALLAVIIMEHVFRSVVLAENDMEVEICGLAMVTRVLVTRRNWLRDRCLWSNGMRVGATAHEKFKILPFRVKIQGLVLIGCAWQCPC